MKEKIKKRESEGEELEMLRKRENDISELVRVLSGEMKMTHQEIADYVGCEKYMVSRWKARASYAKEEYYGRVKEMVMRLSGRGVRYPRQAADLLREEDELERASEIERGKDGEEC